MSGAAWKPLWEVANDTDRRLRTKLFGTNYWEWTPVHPTVAFVFRHGLLWKQTEVTFDHLRQLVATENTKGA